MLMLRPCDAESLRDAAAFEAIFESQRRAWRGSAEGVMADAQIYAQPWGFCLEDVHVPFAFGMEPRTGLSQFAWRKKSQSDCPTAKRVHDNAGHYSLPIRYMRDILKDLISS
ncbi:MAG: hypothetical protein Udaeo2_13970 [Candidatus Udaeobacter sp.]|nr:MAG: hypothetical protein Udaeo2_13970 [Candidatus Udaeobacter sp.]